jgi:hypothetical protein
MTPTMPPRPGPCTLGHASHDTVVVPISLVGQRFHDFAPFPEHRRLDFEIEVFDWHRYKDGASFCYGKDGFAEGVICQGVWESYETRIALEVFATSRPGVVLDFGSSMGWYTMLAALTGHRVIAWEAIDEFASVLRRNADRYSWCADMIEVRNEWVDGSTPPVKVDGEVVLLKVDTEGMEQEVLAMCWDLIEERRVRYMLLEVSPCFRDGYDVLLAQLGECGYDLFRSPDKLCSYRAEFGQDPLGVLERTRIEDVYAYVSSIRQENVVMRRR